MGARKDEVPVEKDGWRKYELLEIPWVINSLEEVIPSGKWTNKTFAEICLLFFPFIF